MLKLLFAEVNGDWAHDTSLSLAGIVIQQAMGVSRSVATDVPLIDGVLSQFVATLAKSL